MSPHTAVRLQRPSLPILLGLLALLQLLFPFRGWVILLAGLGGAWLVGFLWARALARGLGLQREVRSTWTQVGDRMVERVTLTNRGFWPAPWLELSDHSTLPGYPGRRVVGMGGWEVLRWHQEAVCTRRGIFSLGPATLRSGDGLGIYRVELQVPAREQLTVVPPVLPLPQLAVAAGGWRGGERRQPQALEPTVSSAGVREQQPGDSLRSVHWPTTARLGSPYVRLLEPAAGGDWWIFLDMEASAQAGEGQASTQEHGVLLAASLAHQGLSGGRAVGLVTLGQDAARGEDLLWLPPRSGPAQGPAILRALALAAPGATSLGQLLAHSSLRQPESLILITPAAHGAWLEALLALVGRGAAPTLLLLDPASYGGSGAAAATARLLAELGLRHRLIDRAQMEAWLPASPPRVDGRRRGPGGDPWRPLE